MRYLQKYFYVLTGIFSFIIYLTTIAPSVVQIDTGELATVQLTLGIAHPTGYPLFTIIGYLFSLIPLPFTKIFQLNLLAAIYCSIAVSIFTYTSKLVLDNLHSFRFIKVMNEKSKRKKQNKKNLPLQESKSTILEITKIISSFFSGLFLAVSKTFWFQSTSVEVYSLHLLLITVIILFLIKAFLFADKEKQIAKHWIWFSIILALGFTNHMTTLLIIPGIAYLYFYQNKFNVKSLKQILIMLLIFFPVLFLVYSYLPIRATQNPILNWGNPINWERIIRHISGQQYQVWLFSSTEAASKQFKYFIENLTSEFSFTLVVILLGLVYSYLKAKKFFIFNLIVFLSTVLYSINYDINDIDSYFLLAYIALAYFAVFGVFQLLILAEQNKISLVVPVTILIAVFGFQFYSNFKDVNQQNNYIYEDYTKALLNSVPENSIVFSYQWDYFISASYYFQNAEYFRKDVSIIDKELLRRSWYYNQLQTSHPKLLAGIKPEVNQFLEALKPFEREEVFNANLLENLFRRILTGLILINIDKHEYFIAPELVDAEMRHGEFQLPRGYNLVPHLFLFKVVKTNEYVDAPLPDYKIRFKNRDDKYITALKGFLSSMLVRRAMYELQFNKIDRAKIYTEKLSKDFPGITMPKQLSDLLLK
jgi:hypothetical protein